MAEKAGVVIAIDKPRQWSSFQVVNKLKWHIKRTFGLSKFKIGHAGTLDPLASGLLLVCVGSATKRIEELQSGIKEYSGTMVLGATTPCYDLEQAIDKYFPTKQITKELLEEVRKRFVGEIEQVPPMFSAVKIDGRRAYISARDGETVEIEPKKITVYDFEITAYRPGNADPSELQNKSIENDVLKSESRTQNPKFLYRNPLGTVPEGLPQIDFHITCSKGTYIRSIARDYGLALGSGAFLSALRRQRIGEYSIENAISIDSIEQIITPDNPVYECLATQNISR
ncbi:MAG: tRNA pseudouridine(55) synthase TruB [Bacteroidales bacterium]|nr:tRNA pseudouridine(55) synthase TruB [Bacteroidales bacterium]